jgi:hypothetical protein
MDVDWEPEWVPRFSIWGCIARGAHTRTVHALLQNFIFMRHRRWVESSSSICAHGFWNGCSSLVCDPFDFEMNRRLGSAARIQRTVLKSTSR